MQSFTIEEIKKIHQVWKKSNFAPPVPPPREGPYPIPKPKIPTIRIRDVTALRCSEPLRSKVGGPSKVFAMLCGLGPHGDSSL